MATDDSSLLILGLKVLHDLPLLCEFVGPFCLTYKLCTNFCVFNYCKLSGVGISLMLMLRKSINGSS